MPSTYAHRRFGADVLVQLPRELREKITPYRPLYDMGLHRVKNTRPGWATPCTSSRAECSLPEPGMW